MEVSPTSKSTEMCPGEAAAPAIEAPYYDLRARHGMPLHVHDDEAILVYASHGSFSLFTDREIWLASPQCAIWIPPGQPSGLDTRSQPVNLRPLHFPMPIPPELPRSPCMVEVRPFLASLIWALGRLTRAEAASAARIQAVRVLILHELAEAAQVGFHLPLPDELHPGLRRAALAFLGNVGSPAPVARFAGVAGMSLRSFHRRFANQTRGLSWTAWATQVRLLTARQMIESGERIGAAALAVGYDSQSAFAAAFRRHFGKRPREFALRP